VVAWQVGLGCLVMLVLGVAFEQPNYAAISHTGIACFVYMTLVPMGLCYLTWFETLRRLPPTSASTGMLLVPVIGVVSAAFILGEPLGLREIAAMALTLGGVTLALQRARWADGRASTAAADAAHLGVHLGFALEDFSDLADVEAVAELMRRPGSENEGCAHPQVSFVQFRRRYWKWLRTLDDRQAFYIERLAARTLLQPVRNQFAATVQHEADLRGTRLTPCFQRKAFGGAQPNDDLFAPFLARVGLRITGHSDGDEQGSQVDPAQHRRPCDFQRVASYSRLG